MAKTFFITGATGLLGSSIAQRLLRDSNRIIFLARGKDKISAYKRIIDAISFWDNKPDISRNHRIEVLEGDVDAKNFGLSKSDISLIKDSSPALIHCSACTSFDEKKREATFKTNLEGTHNLLELAIETNCRELNYVSTAYVAGDTDRRFFEDDLDLSQKFNNSYEESKFEAEKLLRHFHNKTNISLNVFRPSIIMGDSVCGKTFNFNGLYTYIRAISAIGKKYSCKDGKIPLRLECNKNTVKNIVPVDFVSRAVAEIVKSENERGLRTYHLTNPNPPTLEWLNSTLHEILGLAKLDLISESGNGEKCLSKREMLIKNSISAYRPYLFNEPEFDVSQTSFILKEKGVLFPPTDKKYFFLIINYFMNTLGKELNLCTSLINNFEIMMSAYIGKEVIPGLSSLTQEFVLTLKDTCKSYRIKIENGRLKAFDSNIPERTCFRFITSSTTFENLLETKIRPQDAFFKKKIEIEGSIIEALSLSTVFEKFFQIFREQMNAA